MQPRIPRGLRDVLPTEAAERRALSDRCRTVFESWGYGEVATPAFEYFDLLSSETGEQISREMFRFVDSDGRLVALRPEMTTPIARMVAQRMKRETPPFRLFYVQDVFREEPTRLGQPRQFEQAGVELLGAGGPEADMEIVAVAAGMLGEAGLADFQIGIGHVGLFRLVLEQLGLDAQRRENAKQLATDRNLVGLGSLLSEISPEARDTVIRLVNTRGGSEAIEAARSLAAVAAAQVLLDQLAETYRLLAERDLSSKVLLDFGIIRDFDYYTGLVLEAYAPGVGMPIATGGRYDNLLAHFGVPMPAAGFAAGLERVHIAVAEQEAKEEPSPAMLRVALPKGALFEETLALLERAGFDASKMREDSRKLRFVDEAAGVEYIVARPTDIPTYVEYGGVDLGIAGKDVLLESRARVFELLDLGYGECRFVVAAPEGRRKQMRESYLHLGQVRVATKYPNVTEDFFAENGIQVEIIKLHGSIELAPLVGLADEIVDIVSTGRTLAENRLTVIEEIATSTARLVSNQVSQRLNYDRIGEFVERVEEADRDR